MALTVNDLHFRRFQSDDGVHVTVFCSEDIALPDGRIAPAPWRSTMITIDPKAPISPEALNAQAKQQIVDAANAPTPALVLPGDPLHRPGA